MPETAPTINLLKNKGANYVDRFINWALSAGRMIVILTEIIALSAFIYRFSLDRQIIDLHNKIKQEQNIVEYYKTEEITYRNLQARLQLASQTGTTETNTTTISQDIFKLTPPDIILTQFSYNNNKIQITAAMQSPIALKSYVQSLTSYKRTATLSIDTIENKPGNGLINVTMTISLK